MVEFYTWADKITSELINRGNRHVLHGMWTPSGFFHIGNARTELLMQALVKQVLAEQGADVTHNFIFDNFDDFDKVPAGFDAKRFAPHLGRPLREVPSPDDNFGSWAEYLESHIINYAELFGAAPNFISMYDEYKHGRYDEAVRIVLNNARQVRDIWVRITKSDKPENWIAVMPVCEGCSRSSTTTALAWDGDMLRYACDQDRGYCAGCGYEGSLKPGKGNVKLPWRVHWAATWFINGTTFEPAGKDHFTKGGSVETSQAFCREIFGTEPPLQPPCEFIQLEGKKISGSKGNVITLQDWLSVAEPELLRFMLVSYQPNTVIEFNLTDKFLLLSNRYDEAERAYFAKEQLPGKRVMQLKRQYELAQLRMPRRPVQMPYDFAAFLAQLEPFEDFSKALAILKKTGHVQHELSGEETERVKMRLERAKRWVEHYNPEMKLVINDTVPESIRQALSPGQCTALRLLAKSLHIGMTHDDLYASFFSIAKEASVPSSEFFRAAYQVLMSRDAGPRLAHLILSIGIMRSKKILEQV
ncbi:MAG: lysine--tRNA ligase [Candidatus Aenigmarchaeota archaeon]|nr:lysine--tRNA ligase [Candidatus Aenigmarchaeota archaeon]